MMRKTCLFVCSLAALPALALEPDRIFEKVAPSVWVVTAHDDRGNVWNQGSGVVVARERVMTSCRLLARASKVTVKRENFTLYAELEFPDVQRDLCQLKVGGLNAPPVDLAPSGSLRVGQRVYAIGNPRLVELTISDGLVSSLRGGPDGAPLILTTAPMAAGSNGGGLFDSEGRLVGITGFREGQNLHVAQSADWVREVPQRGQAALAAEAERARAAAAAGAAAAAASGLPPVDTSLPKAMPQVGDTWTYAAIDVRFKPRDRSRKLVYTVKSVTPSKIVESFTDGGKPIGETDFGPTLEGIYRSGVIELSPYLQVFRPLQPGERFGSVPVRGLGTLPTNTGDPGYVLTKGTVAGKEQVTVPAGNFEATRLALDGQVLMSVLYGQSAHRGYMPMKVVVWYAPEVKRVVRVRLEGSNFTEMYELESYKLR
jgi:hypothetical protein